MSTRVRFAPSPTGPLHMGGVRTALFNYLFTKKHGGTMILRIEDTDQNRFVPGAEEYIMESLEWSGIKIDEGIREGGEYGPYRQSERKDIYKEYSDKLIESGWAYYAFDTAEELEGSRLKAQGSGGKFAYDAATRVELRNSLAMTEEEVKRLIEDGVPFVVRFKFPLDEEIVMQDLIRGEVRVNTAALDDKVLFKSDGMPTYHLANVVDDHLMKITHVIRGEEWLPSMPLHVMLYKAFGWTDTQPEFAHLPLIMKPVGKGKLSKRDGDKLGFPVFPINWKNPETGDEASGYRESGYLPEAFINMLALLGWNPGTEQEIFSMDELIQSFSLERVGKSGSRFDPEKSKSLNHAYIQKLGDSVLGWLLGTQGFGDSGLGTGDSGSIRSLSGVEGKKVVGLVKERMNLLTDFWGQAYFFFEAPTEYDAKMVKKGWKEGTGERMNQVIRVIQGIEGSGLKAQGSGLRAQGSSVIAQDYEDSIKAWIIEEEIGMGLVMNPLRLSLVGAPKGPGVFDIMEVLGKEEVINRIQKAITTLG